MRQLKEIFDTHYPYEKLLSGHPHEHTYGFSTPTNQYVVTIDHGQKEPSSAANIVFRDKDFNFSVHNETEKYHAHKVFGTVQHIIKNHLKENPNIKHITFGASHRYRESRVKLYDKLTKNYKPKIDNTSHEKEYRIAV